MEQEQNYDSEWSASFVKCYRWIQRSNKFFTSDIYFFFIFEEKNRWFNYEATFDNFIFFIGTFISVIYTVQFVHNVSLCFYHVWISHLLCRFDWKHIPIIVKVCLQWNTSTTLIVFSNVILNIFCGCWVTTSVSVDTEDQ